MMNRLRAAVLVSVLVAVAASGCEREPMEETDYGQVVHFDTSTVRLVGRRDTVTVRVELAVTGEQKSMGLMERRRLDELAGMLFVYDSIQPAEGGFWMHRTRLPLDIAFLDATGAVVAVKQMTPCESTLAMGCPTYVPGVPYRHALEVNGGFFERHRLAVGDSVDLRAALDAARRAVEEQRAR